MGDAQGRASRGRVLVVEDTADVRELLSDILQSEGFETLSAENGQRALERLERGPHVDLVVLDLMMPVMDGFELLSRMQALPAPSPPVIAMSAYERFREDARSLGAQSFLSKPVDIDVLLARVEETLARAAAPPVPPR